MRTSIKVSTAVSSLVLIIVLVLMGAGCSDTASTTVEPPTPSFEVTALTADPSPVTAGQPVIIRAEITNSGNGEGTYEAVLVVDASTIESKSVTLSPGARQDISFQLAATAFGSRTVEVGGRTVTLEVLKPAEFQATALAVSPSQVVAGKPFTITADINNSGDVEGTLSAVLTVDGQVADTKSVTVKARSSMAVSFTQTLDAGAHTIDIAGANKDVIALKPASLEVLSLNVSPALVLPGQKATAEAEVANAGEINGPVTAVLAVNGVATDSRVVTLEPGAAGKVSFTVVRDTPGSYDLSVGGCSAAFSVPEADTYSSARYFYSIDFPVDFELDDENLNQVLLSRQGVGAIAISTEIAPLGMSQDEYVRISIENARALPQFELLAESDFSRAGALVGHKIEYTFVQEGVRYRCETLMAKRGRYAFVVDAGFRDSVFELNKPTIEAVLDSFTPPKVAVGSYTDSTHGFAISLPSGWDAIDTGRVNSPLLAVGPGPLAVVDLGRIGEEIAVKDFALQDAASFSAYPGYALLSQRDVTLSGGQAAYEVMFAFKSGDTVLKMKTTSVLRGTQALVLRAYGPTSIYDAGAGAINQLSDSLTLIEPRPFGVSRQDSLFLPGGEIVTLDPAKSEDGPGGIVSAIFSGLVKYDTSLKIAPDLADRWTVSPDGRTYTFYLRDSARFHDGKQVTAADFKYSWERALNPETESRKASTYLGDIVGAADVVSGKADELVGVRAVDDLTLEVTIDGPKPYFLGKLTYVTACVVDRANVSRGMKWTDEPNGTGPFKLKEWKKDELLVLERNDAFYTGPAKLKNIVFQLYLGMPLMMYENGEIDITHVSVYDLDRVKDPTDPLNAQLVESDSSGVDMLNFNVSMQPFDDAKVRQAFALAIDMDKIIEVSQKGATERAAGFVPPGVPGYNPDLAPLPFDPALAKELIAESRYGSVEGLPPITMYVLYRAGPSTEAMIAMWQQNLGVEVQVEAVQSLQEWFDLSHQKKIQLCTSGWIADYLDPQDFLEILFNSSSEENRCAYSDPEVDAALAKAAVEQDEALRLKMYQDIERMILDDLPAAPLSGTGKQYALVKPYVKGYSLFPIGVNIWAEIEVQVH